MYRNQWKSVTVLVTISGRMTQVTLEMEISLAGLVVVVISLEMHLTSPTHLSGPIIKAE